MARSAGRRPLLFLVLTLVWSVPFWVLALATDGLVMFLGLPLSALMIVVPAAVACVLTLRESGRSGLRELWSGLVDPARVRPHWWWLVGLAAPLIASVIAPILHSGPAEPRAWIWLIPLFVIFFVGAIPEEIGWTAYATAPLVERWGILPTGLVLGLVWEAWHWIPRVAMGVSVSWLVGATVLSVVLRLLMVLMYARGGQSLALACAFHSMLNAAPAVLTGFAAANPWLMLPGALLVLGLVWVVAVSAPGPRAGRWGAAGSGSGPRP